MNLFLGSLLLNGCDFDFLAVGSQVVVVRGFSLFSTWIILTFATMIYEISRMRFYFAKHAFRIHKLSSCHISSQVILEASALSSLYLLTLSYFSSVTLFSNFPSVYSQVSLINRSVDGFMFLAIFAANIVGLGYYCKLCKHVKKRVSKFIFVFRRFSVHLIPVPVSGRGRRRTGSALCRGLEVRVPGEWRHQGALQDQHREGIPQDHHHRGGLPDADHLPASDRACVPGHGCSQA